jgi:hypothetical protein
VLTHGGDPALLAGGLGVRLSLRRADGLQGGGARAGGLRRASDVLQGELGGLADGREGSEPRLAMVAVGGALGEELGELVDLAVGDDAVDGQRAELGAAQVVGDDVGHEVGHRREQRVERRMLSAGLGLGAGGVGDVEEIGHLLGLGGEARVEVGEARVVEGVVGDERGEAIGRLGVERGGGDRGEDAVGEGCGLGGREGGGGGGRDELELGEQRRVLLEGGREQLGVGVGELPISKGGEPDLQLLAFGQGYRP